MSCKLMYFRNALLIFGLPSPPRTLPSLGLSGRFFSLQFSTHCALSFIHLKHHRGIQRVRNVFSFLFSAPHYWYCSVTVVGRRYIGATLAEARLHRRLHITAVYVVACSSTDYGPNTRLRRLSDAGWRACGPCVRSYSNNPYILPPSLPPQSNPHSPRYVSVPYTGGPLKHPPSSVLQNDKSETNPKKPPLNAVSF